MSLSWPGTSLSEAHLLKSIYILLGGDDRLLEFLFHRWEPKLRVGEDRLLKEAQALSSGERILIQAAVDLWSGNGGVRLGQLIDILDDGNMTNFIKSLCHLREIREPVLHGLIDIESPSFHI